MAEIMTADVGEEGAPGESATPQHADQPESPAYVTRDELESVARWMAEQTNESITRAWTSTQQLFDKKVNEFAKAVGVSQERAATILEEMATETIGPERVQQARDKVEAEQKAQANAERLREAEASAEAAKKAEAATRAGVPNPEQIVVNALWVSMLNRMNALGKEQGIAAQEHIDAVKASMFTDRNANGDPVIPAQRDYVSYFNGFEDKVRDRIRTAAKAVYDAEQGRAEVDTSTASGGRGTAFDNYIKALREGKPLPPAAEIDRITAGRRYG